MNWHNFAARPPSPKPDPWQPRRNGNVEARIQASVVDYVRWVAPEIIVFHVANGGLRSKSEAARLKWTGVLPGVSDFILVLPGGRAAFWEVKAPRGGLSPDQRAFIDRLTVLGHSWGIVRSIEDARHELAALGIETKETPR